jgi:hypothetical protein
VTFAITTSADSGRTNPKVDSIHNMARHRDHST